MKGFKSFIWILVLPALFSSCEKYLDVESESKFSDAYVYSNKGDANLALNAVYASLLSDDVYGEKYMRHYAFNSDVEFSTFSSMTRNPGGNDFKCFDGEAHSGDVAATWRAAYNGVERANLVIYGLENSTLLHDKLQKTDIEQMLGEAKVLRAMFMHDLVVHFGDIPFPMEPTIHNESLVLPITGRDDILDSLILDLKKTAPKMRFAEELVDGVERASKEFCWAMIARMALTRAGFSLRPNEANPLAVGRMGLGENYRDYYKVAMVYADSVIISEKHALNKKFVEVFVDQCNYKVAQGDDPIFEIPFTKGHNGQVGYIHGPEGIIETGTAVSTGLNTWGRSTGTMRLNAFYRFSFDRDDLRNWTSVGLWRYNYNGTPQFINSTYTVYANKWSKFWATTGTFTNNSEGNTGINYPYMRYADVLLMYAEAVNEVEGGVSGIHGDKAKEALKKVRRRAFPENLWAEKVEQYVSTMSFTKEAFFEAIRNERKWEFGGENMRWKDLVRWGLYSQTVYDAFMEYYVMGAFANGEFLEGFEKYTTYPTQIWYNYHDAGYREENPDDIEKYQNRTLNILKFENLYTNIEFPGLGKTSSPLFNWETGETYPRDECLYSFRGYIRGGAMGNLAQFKKPANIDEAKAMKPVRYILPIPRQVVLLSNGAYTNYYGY